MPFYQHDMQGMGRIGANILLALATVGVVQSANPATSFAVPRAHDLAFAPTTNALPLSLRKGLPTETRPGRTVLNMGMHRDDQVTCRKSALRAPATSLLVWREYRARLIQAETPVWMRRASQHSGVWAHPIGQLEKGCLLVEVPKKSSVKSDGAKTKSSGTSQNGQGRRVIFLVENDKQHGSYGLILNQPTPCSIGDFTERLPHFADSKIHFGGEGHRAMEGRGPNRELHAIHPYPSLAGAEQVLDGVCVGADLRQASVFAGKKMVNPRAFKFFYSASCWGAGQLEQELEEGQWVAAACSKELILKESSYWEKPLWQVVLEVMGGKHGLLCRELCDEL
mmetsp:Transcript_31469/g.48790  ORF Transcript_31469/g.48790 Transcript_31469/m.48790 type:complete len:338 (-) Transcript_31469:306-1319(-)